MSLTQLPAVLHPLPAGDEPEDGHDPGVTRRSLLLLAGTVGAALALPVGIQRLGQGPGPELAASRFTPLIGRAFTLDLPDAAVPLVLVAVEGLADEPVAEHAFALRFTGPPARRQGGEVGTLRGPGVRTTLLVVPSSLPRATDQVWVATVHGGGHHV
jgi:hypothetical protein